MSNRWKVTRAGFPTWRPGEHWWQVQELDDDGYWYADPDGRFSHFAPALVYADRMARTITVTLPRDPLVWESGWDSDGRIYVEEANGNEICYEPGQLGEIALRLLAYHYLKDNQ